MPATASARVAGVDALTEMDHAVLELIEHSPTGVVPHTPSHQDALRRLTAAHQVYPSAEHDHGYVTARSLAGRPCFQATNLEVLRAGQAESLEPNAEVFNRYVRSLPAELQRRAESSRATVAGKPAHHRARHGMPSTVHDPVHTLFLVPGGGPHPGLPGNYLYGFMLETAGGASGASWSIHLHDRQDGEVVCDCGTVEEALTHLQELVESAPFHMEELEAFGFRFT